MLAPSEFLVGTFAFAPLGSLILPRGEDEAAAIVGTFANTTLAVFLDKHDFTAIPTAQANWGGIIVPGVGVEVDEKSASEQYGRTPLGCLVRSKTTLSLRAKLDGGHGRMTIVTLVSDLPDVGEETAVFGRWRVVLGSGQEKRVLIDVQAAIEQR